MGNPKRGMTPGPYIEQVQLDRGKFNDPEHYAFNIPALKNLTKLDLHPQVTFFVGENGSGKSTLLEAIAIANDLNPEGGSRNLAFETRASHSLLHKAIRSRRYHGLVPDAWFLRAESLFNVATAMDNVSAMLASDGSSLHERSHGEAFIALMENRFGQGLYFLDEPEAALSPQRQLEFLILLDQLVENHSQLLIATHSPILMSYPRATIYQFDTDGIRPIRYADTEHYRVTKSFLDSPERMLRHLLRGE